MFAYKSPLLLGAYYNLLTKLPYAKSNNNKSIVQNMFSWLAIICFNLQENYEKLILFIFHIEILQNLFRNEAILLNIWSNKSTKYINHMPLHN